MANNQLVLDVALAIKRKAPAGYGMTEAEAQLYAQAAADTILAAISEPNEGMQLVVSANWGRRTWSEYQRVLAASPLGEQNDG